MVVEIPAAPGRKARKAELCLSFGKVEIVRPTAARGLGDLPKTFVTLVIGREIDAPEGQSRRFGACSQPTRSTTSRMHAASSASIVCAGPSSNCSEP